MKRLGDLRTTVETMAAAEAAMAAIAKDDCLLAAEAARTEKKVLAITTDHDARTLEIRTRREVVEKALAGFITANKPLFEPPNKRKVKTAAGEFGLQLVSETRIDDWERAKEWIWEQLRHAKEDAARTADLMAALVTKVLPAKDGLRILIVEKGDNIPGVAYVNGDTVVCKVSKALVAEARKKAEEEAA